MTNKQTSNGHDHGLSHADSNGSGPVLRLAGSEGGAENSSFSGLLLTHPRSLGGHIAGSEKVFPGIFSGLGPMQLSLLEDCEFSEPAVGELIDYRAERNLARAAEFLVAFDIGCRGFDCFTVGEQLRYDLIADIGGLRRIQVKMNRRATFRAPGSISMSYTFGNSHPLRSYANDIDLFAFVAMDRKVVFYLPPSGVKRNNLHVPASKMTDETSDLSWSQSVRGWVE